MQDYTLKVNAHKHKGEKNIQIDTIVSYMRIIYNATVSFANYKKILVNEFDANYANDIAQCRAIREVSHYKLQENEGDSDGE